MFLWVMIIVGVLFGYLGYKKGLYVMFATFFNLMFAIFVAVLTTPKLLSLSAGYEDSGYLAAASILLLFILVFGVLQFFAYLYFLRDSEGFFPKLLDKAGAVICGFLSGYIICSVLLLAVCVMPFTVNCPSRRLYSRSQLQSLSVPGVEKVCDFLGWYSLHCFEGNSEKAINRLLTLGKEEPAEDSDITDDGVHLPDILSQSP